MMLTVVLAAGPAFASYMPAAALRPDQPNLRWRGKQIRVALSDSLLQPTFNIKADSDVMGAVRRSFKAWEDVTDIEFILETSDKQGISPSGAVGDGISLITIAQTPENVLLFSSDPDKESAKTRIFYSKGFITEADIVLNPFQLFSTDGFYGTFDLQATLTHEIGHLLGLRHSGVLGSTMSESLSKNGTFGIPDLSARALAINDIAAVRELYEGDIDDEECCGSIEGKITGPNSRLLKNGVRVWAQESSTGRVFAQSEAGPDGIYRLGGLPDSGYTVYWQIRDDNDVTYIGELGVASVEGGMPATLNGRVTRRISGPSIEYIGINNRLANTAVPIRSGRDHIIHIGGRGLDPATLKLDFDSPHIRISSTPYVRPDFGDEPVVLSFMVTIDEDAPAGLYTIFASIDGGSRTSMIGALKVN